VEPGYIYQILHLLQIPPGMIKNIRELWDIMASTIDTCGYEGKVGMHIDVAAATYYGKEKEYCVGLFSDEDKSRDDMITMYKELVKTYPIIVLEDPLDEEDYEGHAVLTQELNIQIVGDDLFTTSANHLLTGVEVGACNAVLLIMNQIGTISETFDIVRLAY
jgi:enolase